MLQHQGRKQLQGRGTKAYEVTSPAEDFAIIQHHGRKQIEDRGTKAYAVTSPAEDFDLPLFSALDRGTDSYVPMKDFALTIFSALLLFWSESYT